MRPHPHPHPLKQPHRCARKRACAWLICVALVSGWCASALAQQAPGNEANDPSLTEQASEYMRDYLSDSKRVGSLVGSVVGGALTAHPAGPVVGGLVGFFVGKSSMFSEQEEKKTETVQSLDPRRPITAGQSQAAASVSFGSGQAVSFASPPPQPAAISAPAALTTLPSPLPIVPPTMITSPVAPPPNRFNREQIAQLCGGGAALGMDPRLKNLCLYHQHD